MIETSILEHARGQSGAKITHYKLVEKIIEKSVTALE